MTGIRQVSTASAYGEWPSLLPTSQHDEDYPLEVVVSPHSSRTDYTLPARPLLEVQDEESCDSSPISRSLIRNKPESLRPLPSRLQPPCDTMSGYMNRIASLGNSRHGYRNIPLPPPVKQEMMQRSVDSPDYPASQVYFDSPSSRARPSHQETAHNGARNHHRNPFEETGFEYGHDHASSPRQNPFDSRSNVIDASAPDCPNHFSFDRIDPRYIADDDEPEFRVVEPHRKLAKKTSAIGALNTPGRLSGGATSAARPMVGTLPDRPHTSPWKQTAEYERKTRRRRKWIAIIVLAVIVLGGAGAGIYFAIKSTSGGTDSSSSASSTSDPSSSSDTLTQNSAQIKALMNNKDLHPVFPCLDYTPMNTQWPACLTDPPSQDNVTMDIAVLSQLTSAVRFYGTDCNQTEMALTAINNLGLNDTMKVWLGVWIDGNSSTQDRQMSKMYDILATYPQSHFSGVIVGNEALFRQDVTEQQLATLLTDTRNNLTSKGITLSVSTSDIGSEWTTALANASDHVMANVHPFFGGVPAAEAASWTYDFWQTYDVAVSGETTESASKTGIPRNIISETGWPSGGGNDCGSGNNCASTSDGSIAGAAGMTTFLNDWVCQANENGTMYFWFEAFDEPWKAIYNSGNETWEDKWGLLTSDRQLKDGLTIPDCNGNTPTVGKRR